MSSLEPLGTVMILTNLRVLHQKTLSITYSQI